MNGPQFSNRPHSSSRLPPENNSVPPSNFLSSNPSWWDDDDHTIAQILHSIPVPESSRQAVLARLRSGFPARNVSSPTAVSPTLQSQSATIPQTSSVAPITQARSTVSRRILAAIATLAASLLLGLFWWSAAQSLTVAQLITTSIEQVERDGPWEMHEDSDEIFLASSAELRNVLNRTLRVPVEGAIRSRAILGTNIAPQGRLWKLQLRGGKEFYVVEFHSPRKVQTIGGPLRILSNASDGWSIAAVRSDNLLFVFVSKSDLNRALRPSPLA